MSMLAVVLCSAICLVTAYCVYGPLLARLVRLDPNADTPATTLRDDIDYVPIESKFLLSQHFSAIAAAGPIVGPILAGVMFGWVPALIWILVGSIFIGGVHDFMALVASIRHKARSIAEVVRDHMSGRSYILFLSFVWLALVYIIVAFTDVTASSFLGDQKLENGEKVLGGAIASSSLLYLVIPVVMGLLLRFRVMTVNVATLVFLPLVVLSIWVGQFIPFDAGQVFGLSAASAQRFWNISLLAYCLVASVLPMWLLLQPRGHLGGYFLYAVLLAGGLGILFGGQTIEYPAFRGFEPHDTKGIPQPLVPLLFITIACGACSGFHSIIASGTTSKQLRKETDARLIGYGAMLLEAMVAIISLCCVMMLKPSDPLINGGDPKPQFLYALGIGNFMGLIGIPKAFAVSFGLMAFTTFVYDTLDVCTRLGRYIIQELTGLSGASGKWLGTILTAGVPLVFLLGQPVAADGKPVAIWRIYWGLFGASNQLLAALTLLGVTVWLWRTYRAAWVIPVVGVPCALMYTMSMWALIRMIWPPVSKVMAAAPAAASQTVIPVPYVAGVLAILGVLILVEALIALIGPLPKPPDERRLATA